MVVQISVKNPENLKKGDILIYDGQKFSVITKEDIVKDVVKDMDKMKIDFENLIHAFKNTKESVKQKQNNFFKAFLKGEKL
jgi:Ni2+-binding GTPase involved in maturation of urease and hydrogenase